MRALILTGDLGGGTGNHLLAMTSLWERRRGCEAEIVSQVSPGSRLNPGVPVHVVPATRLEFYPLSQLRRLTIASRHISRFRPDLVHTYFFWPIMYGRALKALGRVPLLIENREDQGFSWGPPEYKLLRATRRLPDRVICVSEAVRQVVLEKERLDPSRVIVVHNGIEVPPAKPHDSPRLRARLGLRPEHLVVGMVANFNRRVKRVSYLIEAAPHIIRAVPEVRFVLVGEGNEEQELRHLADRLGVAEHVIFAGRADDPDEYYRLMSLSVLTSLTEGLSITLLESMSYGLPVVVTDVGGNPEVVADGVTGYLVPRNDVKAFVDSVIGLLRDDERRARFGAAARERVKQHFDLRDVAARYLAVYDELLSQKRAPTDRRRQA